MSPLVSCILNLVFFVISCTRYLDGVGLELHMPMIYSIIAKRVTAGTNTVHRFPHTLGKDVPLRWQGGNVELLVCRADPAPGHHLYVLRVVSSPLQVPLTVAAPPSPSRTTPFPRATLRQYLSSSTDHTPCAILPAVTSVSANPNTRVVKDVRGRQWSWDNSRTKSGKEIEIAQ